MHHWLQQPRDLVSARPKKTSRDRQTPRRKAGRHQCCSKPHARAGMSQACSRLLFIGMQIDAVLLPSASLPNTSSTCRLCRTASPSWLQVPCWLMLSNRRMRCGRLKGCRFDGTPPYDGTHAGSDWLYAHTSKVLSFCCILQLRTYITINSVYCMHVRIHKRSHWHLSGYANSDEASSTVAHGIILMTIFIENASISPDSLKKSVPATVDQMLYIAASGNAEHVAASGDKLFPRLETTCCYICKRRLLRG